MGKMGRPTKLTPEVKKMAINIINSRSVFNTEKELCDYIEDNMVSFVDQTLGAELLAIHREKTLDQHQRFVKGNQRPDFMLETSKGDYIIEVKKAHLPHQARGIATGIGQLLGYKAYAELQGMDVAGMVLIADYYSPLVDLTIDSSELPIIYVALDKRFQLTGGNNG